MKRTIKKSNKKTKTKEVSFLQTFSQKQLGFFAGIFILTLTSLLLLGKFTQPKNEYHKEIETKPTLAPPMKFDHPATKRSEGYAEVIEYKVRQYNPKDMFLGDRWNVKYPEELETIGEEDLTPLSCTQTYWEDISSGGGFATNEDGGPAYALVDERLLTYMKALNNKYAPKTVKLISACSTESGKSYIFYGIRIGGGGDYWGKPYLGIDSGSGINEVIGDIGSGGCSALQLVKNEFLYIKCSASEGGGGEHMVAQINLSNKSATRLLYCLTEGSKVSCKH